CCQTPVGNTVGPRLPLIGPRSVPPFSFTTRHPLGGRRLGPRRSELTEVDMEKCEEAEKQKFKTLVCCVCKGLPAPPRVPRPPSQFLYRNARPDHVWLLPLL